MSQENVTKFNAYLDGIKGMQTDSVKLVPGLATALNMRPAQVQQFLATNYPAMSAMLAGLPQMQADFANLLGVMSASVNIFAQVPAGWGLFFSGQQRLTFDHRQPHLPMAGAAH